MNHDIVIFSTAKILCFWGKSVQTAHCTYVVISTSILKYKKMYTGMVLKYCVALDKNNEDPRYISFTMHKYLSLLHNFALTFDNFQFE